MMMKDEDKTKEQLIAELTAMRERLADIQQDELGRQNKVLQAINGIFQESLICKTEDQLGKTCLKAAEELTGSQFGFIGELNSSGRMDTIAISDPGWECCRLPKSRAPILISNMEVRGLWGEVIRKDHFLISNDPAKHPARIGLPHGHPPLLSYLGVPLRRGGNCIGVISLGNKIYGYDDFDRQAIESLAITITEALYNKRNEQRLTRQAQEILEISTPVLQVWKGMVVATLIGTIDSKRTYEFMERLLSGIVNSNSEVALLDITGVPMIDTHTAQHLIETITATRLLGAKVILTGVSPAIAQTIVHLGIDLKGIETCSSLETGMRRALKFLDFQVVSTKPTKEAVQ